jgi:zinc protease
MKSLAPLALAATLALCAIPAVAQDGPPAPPPVEEAAPAPLDALAKVRDIYPDNLLVETLPNGLQVVIEENHANPVARVHAYMRVGSIYEGEYLGSGLSHYMEHIVSGGSTRRQVEGPDGKPVWVGRTEEEQKALLKSIGRDSNASTYYNFTNYYITTKSEMVPVAVDLISDYLQNCQFDAKEVAREQRVVQQELMRNLDNPNRERSYLFSETMFKVHPARVPVIGYRDCIQRITREDMFRFYKQHYTPQNCVVAVVGDVDKEETLALITKAFGGWKRSPLEPYQIPQEPPQTRMRWAEREHGSTKTTLVAMGVPTIDLRHPDLYALDMLSNVLGISASARLPKVFEHDPKREVTASGLATSSWTPAFGAGRFGVYFSADTPAQARGLVWEIWTEMNRLKEELVTQEEIDRALKVLTKQFHQGKATVDDRAQELASSLAWLQDPLFNDTYLEKIRAVTPAQIREAARTYLIPERLNVAMIKPPAGEAAAAEAGPAGEGAGQVKKLVLPNGLTLLIKRVPGYGMVDVTAAFNGGVIYEDAETNGLFFLMGNTFWRGTESRPFPQLIQEMDELGMSLSAESHNNVYFVSMQSLASDLEPSFGIFSDVLLNAAVDATWVERLKQILLARVLPNQKVQADAICDEAVRGTLYSKHPYVRQRFGTAETVASFTPEQVRVAYETYTRPNNCVLAIYGDVDPAAVEALVTKQLGGWKKGEIPASQVVADPGISAPKTVEVANAQVRTNYRVAWRAPSRQEEEPRWALSVLNAIIGSSGWLHARLREGEADYVYAVHGAHYPGDGGGHYAIITDFQPKDEAAVVKIIDQVVADAMAGKFTDRELELAKSMISARQALGKKENANACQGDALSELYGQGWDADERFFAGIKQVTRQDVIDCAKAVFSRPAVRVLVRPKAK